MTEARFATIAKLRFEADLASQDPARKIAGRFCRLAADLAHELLENYDAGSDRKGPWTVTYTGRRIWPEDPRPEDFCIEDIAHHLSLTNRFCGATAVPYSVANHSVLVSFLVPQEYALYGLLHDASESFLCDITSPVKRLLKEEYGPLERRYMEAIAQRFGFDLDDPDAKMAVKEADNRMLLAEVRDLLPCGYINHRPDVEPAPPISPWDPKRSEEEFLARYQQLCP